MNKFRAKIYTEIHAKPKHVVSDDSKASSSSTSSDGATATTSSDATSETLAKKSCNVTSAVDKKAQAKKEKSLKDKKKTLKRL